MTDQIVVNQAGAILRVQINRPHKKNALTTAMYSALADALERAEREATVRVLFLTGSEDSFTSGNDLTDFLQNPPVDETSPVSRFLKLITTAQKPIVAAVNGVAVGVGTTLLLHCDLVYAAMTARFKLPFVNLAVVPEAGSTYLLPQMIGHRRAAELLMLGEMFSADLAQEVGLVNQVTPAENLQELAWQKAEALAQKAPEALRLTKMLLKRGTAQAVAEAMQEEGRHFRQQLASPEAREVMQAFMERRPPDFSNLR